MGNLSQMSIYFVITSIFLFITRISGFYSYFTCDGNYVGL